MKAQLGTKEFNDSAMEMFGGKSKQQTAVEWLIEQLEWDDSKIARVIGLKKYNQVVSQAKEMEKQQSYSEEEVLAFGKSCFYKGFDKAENDDANCYTAFREQIGGLFEQFKKK